MGATAVFSPTLFAQTYPELSYINPTQAQGYFNQAVLFHANDGSGPVEDAGQQLTLLNMVTAHLCFLFAPKRDGEPMQADTVGRISDANQGTVSASLENEYPPGTPQWWQQSRYGSAYWAATVAYRTFRYRARKRNLSLNGPMGRPGWFGSWPQ